MGRLTAFDKDPMKIAKTKGSMITAQQGNRQVTRNSSYFKKTNFKPLLHSDPDDQDTVVNWLKIVLKEIMPPVHQTYLHLERLTMTCPVQALHNNP